MAYSQKYETCIFIKLKHMEIHSIKDLVFAAQYDPLSSIIFIALKKVLICFGCPNFINYIQMLGHL